MKLKTDKTARELSDDENYDAWDGRTTHNPPALLRYGPRNNRVTVTLPTGTTDNVYIFIDADHYRYVVAVNHRHDYCGLSVFDPAGDEAGELFVQNSSDLPMFDLPKGLDHTPINIAKALAQYIQV